jgi:hypothetical protein
MKRKLALGIAALSILTMCLFAASVPLITRAETFDSLPPGVVKWKVIDYNRNVTHPARIPFKLAVGNDGGIGFDFLYTPDTALLGTSHPSYRGDLLGDMSGKSVSARVGVTVTSGTIFEYYNEVNNPGRPANVRLFFQTDTSGKFEETDYWWSNPVSVDLQALALGGDVTISESLANPNNWSDYNGHYGTQFPIEFANAVKNVQFIGLSFGGGSFFENGVGIQPGTGSGYFRLMDFTATP